MKNFLLIIIAGAMLAAPWRAAAQASDPEERYSALRESYMELRDNPAKRKYREHWSRIAGGLIALADENKGAPVAPRALFTAAELFRDLRRLSSSPHDLEDSIRLYERTASEYPQSNLADDALYWKAMLLSGVKNDQAGACETLAVLAEKHSRGDMTARAGPLIAECGRRPPSETKAGEASGPPDRPDGGVTSPITPETAGTPPDAGSAAASAPDAGSPDGSVEAAKAPTPPMITAMKDGLKEKIRNGTVVTGMPLSEQLGLKFKRIVIDPGHGGEDTGAVGRRKTKEKDVVLAIAKKLAKKLREELKVEVIMTRTGDVTVPLPDRASLAKAVKADMFISIHANANPNRKFRGIETYYLNNTDDRAAQKVAAVENASLEAGLSDLRMTLLDLALSANVDDSIRLANLVQRETVVTLQRKFDGVQDHGVKFALFYVLFGTEVPSILVETSFISNPVEELRLRNPKYQAQLAAGILNGIKKYIEGRTLSARFTVR